MLKSAITDSVLKTQDYAFRDIVAPEFKFHEDIIEST